MGQRLDRKKLMGLKNCLEGLVKKSIKGWSKYLTDILFAFFYIVKTPQINIVTRALHFSCFRVTLDKIV